MKKWLIIIGIVVVCAIGINYCVLDKPAIFPIMDVQDGPEK